MKLLSKQILYILFFCLLVIVAEGQTKKRFFTGDNMAKSDIDKLSRPAERATRDMENLPPAVSLKPYAPLPDNQGMHGTCVAWSTAARTISYCIQRKITDPKKSKLPHSHRVICITR